MSTTAVGPDITWERVIAVEGLIRGVSGMNAAVSDFGAAVAAGFTVSTTGGEALLQAIEEIAVEAERVRFTADRLAQEPPLGTTPAAQAYKPFLASVASDPVQGFLPVLEAFRKDLAQLSEQVKQAMGLYSTTEQDVTQNVTTPGGQIHSA